MWKNALEGPVITYPTESCRFRPGSKFTGHPAGKMVLTDRGGADVPGVPESLGCDSSVCKAPFEGVKEKTLLILVKVVQETLFKVTVIRERLTGAPS